MDYLPSSHNNTSDLHVEMEKLRPQSLARQYEKATSRGRAAIWLLQAKRADYPVGPVAMGFPDCVPHPHPPIPPQASFLPALTEKKNPRW